MFIAIFVGLISGVIGVVCWGAIELLLNAPGVYHQLEGRWFLVPPVIGAIAALVHTAARSEAFGPIGRRPGDYDLGQPLVDLFESFHFGVFRVRPLIWVARAIVSFLSAFLGGIFGVEGCTLELSFATLPFFSRYMRLFLEEKQVFVICTMSAALGVAIGVPFSGALIALELVHAVEGRIRVNAVLAALMSYGVAIVLQSAVFSFFADSSLGPTNIIGSLFMGLKPLNLEPTQWLLLGMSAVVVGLGSGLFSMLTSRWLVRGSEFFSQVFGTRYQLGLIVGGLLIGLTVWLVPESFSEPWRLREDITWMRLSSAGAIVLLISKWGMLILAFSAWGSSGVFSPVLLLGTLFGYAIGNSIDSSWALPLAFAGAATSMSAMFRTPIAAGAMVLELGRDGPTWALATVAVLASAILQRMIRTRPLHELLLERRGIRVVGGRAANVLAKLKTSDAMSSDVTTVRDNASVQELREAVAASRHNILGVCSTDGKYLGLLALEQLPAALRRAFRPDARPADIQLVERIIEIRDLVDTYTPTVSPNDSLEKALTLLQKTPCISVVDENCQLCGFLFETSINAIYKREIASTVFRQL